MLICCHRTFAIWLKGGELPSFYINNRYSIVPTLSILALHQDIGYNPLPTESFEQLISKCTEYAKRFTMIQMKYKEATIEAHGSEFDTASRISDANLDLIGVLQLNSGIQLAMGVNEWHEQEKRPEFGELVTIYDGVMNQLRITRPDAYVWLQAPFSIFMECSSIEDYAEILKLESLIGRDKLKLLASLKIQEPEITILSGIEEYENHKEFQEYKNTLKILPWTKNEINKIMRTAKNIATSERLVNLVKASTPLSNASKITYLEALRTFYSTLDWIKYHPKINIVDIYIEYSYNKERAHELYAKIHSHTLKIIQEIMNLELITNNKRIFALRFNVDAKSPIIDIKNLMLEDINHVDFQGNETVVAEYFIYDQTNYSVVQVPPTDEKISNDEQIFIQTYDTIYNIQIEHSESGSDHKSNFIEFIGRTLSRITDVDTMREILRNHTKYLSINQSKLQWEPKGKNVNLKSTRIYKAFGDLNEALFEPDPIRKT